MDQRSWIIPDTWIDVNDLVGLKGDEVVRGLGHTTHQMKEAPQGAVFVWCNGHLHYPRALACFLGRPDLEIQPASWIDGSIIGRGRKGQAIVIDHAHPNRR